MTTTIILISIAVILLIGYKLLHISRSDEMLSNFIEGDMRYDHRGWVYVFTAGNWEQVIVHNRALKRDELGENGLSFVKAFTQEEEQNLPYLKQYRKSLEILKKETTS